MKVNDFKKIIREEVKKAIQEELRLLEEEKAQQEVVQEQVAAPVSAPKQVNMFGGVNPLAAMLDSTRKSMSTEDYRNIVNADSSMIRKPNFASSQASQMGMTGPQPGLDLSQLDFVKNAKAVLDLANEKSKNKLG